MNEKNKNNEHWQVLVLIAKQIAEKKGISQEEIAEKLGMHRQSINRLFNMHYRPRLDIFIDILKVLKVNFFFEDQESKTDLNQIFEDAMKELGRRNDELKNN